MEATELKDEFVRTAASVGPRADEAGTWAEGIRVLDLPQQHHAGPEFVVEVTLPNGERWDLHLKHSRTGYPRDLEAAMEGWKC